MRFQLVAVLVLYSIDNLKIAARKCKPKIAVTNKDLQELGGSILSNSWRAQDYQRTFATRIELGGVPACRG
uniref:Uncharacterized protein n=1 Tax=Arundo donax TaxID=35708 RepID=A0A0A9GWJ3_ARUDO